MTSHSDTQVPSKELVDQLRYVSQSANGYTELADACIAEIQRLAGMSAELLSICMQMREWLKPELVKEPDRTFFWKLNERIERFTKGRGATAEPPAAPKCSFSEVWPTPALVRRLREFSDGSNFGDMESLQEALQALADDFETGTFVLAETLRPSQPPGATHPDTERLDWLEKARLRAVPFSEQSQLDEGMAYLWWQIADGKKSISGHPLPTLREAIDAARLSQTKEVR